MAKMKKIAIIGGGAAGFFTAINIAEKCINTSITIFEKSSKLLSKVKISGGGRCNVTNQRCEPGELIQFYPRGNKKLYKLFERFSTNDMIDWLKNHDVETKSEPDLRIFPKSNKSQTIIDCFLNLCQKHEIKIETASDIKKLRREKEQWLITVNEIERTFDSVVWATGSSEKAWKTLRDLGIKQNDRVPSLFTFNIDDGRIKTLSGLSFSSVQLKIAGSRYETEGPLLITHWGMSGPAVLKLSSFAANFLFEKSYQFEILINFLNGQHVDIIRIQLMKEKGSAPDKKLKNLKWDLIPNRYWNRILEIKQIENKKLGELSKKDINRLLEELCQARFKVEGKSTFKEEFVTSGGIKLNEIDLNTFESIHNKGLYFAGEVLDIDALTGGFNFQACWSAGWVISEHIKSQYDK